MYKLLYLIPVVMSFSIASTAVASNFISQEAFATAYGGSSSSDVIANPSGLSDSSNVTSGNVTGTENITLVP